MVLNAAAVATSAAATAAASGTYHSAIHATQAASHVGTHVVASVIPHRGDKGKEAKIIEFRPAKWAYGIGETPGRNGDTIKYAVNGEPRYAVSCDYFEAEMVCIPPHSLSTRLIAFSRTQLLQPLPHAAPAPSDAPSNAPTPAPTPLPSDAPTKRKRNQRQLLDGTKIKGSYDKKPRA